MATVAVIIAGLVGLAVGAVIVLLLRRRPSAELPGRADFADRETMPADLILELLPTATVLIDDTGTVQLANRAARELSLVHRGSLAVAELNELAREARRTGSTRRNEVSLSVDGLPRRPITVGVRAEPLLDGKVVLVVDDLTESRRVESVRRDFVANVGHEIKTPVGALTVLTEAALEAQDDPEAVRRFLGRMQHETHRLSRLVQELIDLSRLQGGEPLPKPAVVSMDVVLDEAIDRARPVADAKAIALVRGGETGVDVTGDESQLVTAIGNLLDNAVAYSGEGTRVAVGVRRREGIVEVSVSDEGIGIAERDLDRIFERFYRVDPARSRATGGTGLGLSIVKHIVSNHGGEVTVWSRPGEGSTFTVRLLPAGDLPAIAPAEEVEQP